MSESFTGKILVVDDDVEFKDTLVRSLTAQSFVVRGFTDPLEALALLKQEEFDVLLSDLMMPEMDGIALTTAALEIDPYLVPIIMTGQGTIQTSVDAMKAGTFDYVLKPFRIKTVMPMLTRAMNARRLRLENLQLKETVAIYELCQTISFTLDPQTILSKLADAALQQTQADEVSILLPAEGGEELYVAAIRGKRRQHLLGERVSLQKSISGWVAREREPVILHGAVSDERFQVLWPHPEIHSSISVPMQVANKLVGVVNLNAIDRPRPFTLGQMKALTILTSTAGAALETASLHGQVARQRERLDNIVGSVPGVVWEAWGRPGAANLRFDFVSDYVETILGYSVDEWLSTPNFWMKVVHPDDRERTLKAAYAGFASHEPTTIAFRWVRKDGSTVWAESTSTVVRNEAGDPVGLRGVTVDISERKRAEEALRQSEERYRDLVENAHDIIYSHDLQGNYTSINKAGEVVTGYTVEEALKLNLADTTAPEYLPKAIEMMQRKLAGEHVTAYEVEIIAKDGHRVKVEANTKLVYENGVPVGVQGIARDITERKQLEEQLRQSQKIEAIGQLAGGVAHDFNNLLTAINGYSSLALQRIDDSSSIKPYLEEVKKAGDRAANLTRQLLAFGRKQILQPMPLDLNNIVTDMNKMLRRLIGEDIELTAKLSLDLKKIKADPGQIEQVIVNLVVNARDAMPHGGNLTIETANVTLSDAYATLHVGAHAGTYVMLAVSDTGSGMDEVTRARIFEPFFTTKDKGKGTGLGLSTVYGIVQQSGGSIWVYSELNRGTTFKVYLPQLASEVDLAEEKDSKADQIVHGSETILLVEDEDVVRGLATNILETAGYKVLSSAGQDAVEVCERVKGRIHLLLTDVVMPQTSGKEIADKLQKLRPRLKVLYMSGYTDEAIVHHGVLDDNVEFIQKPFTPAALSRKVREVLDSNGRP